MFLVIGSRIGLCILQHGLKGKVVVDALDTLNESIGNYHFGIRAALSPAVTVTTTGIWHIAFPFIDVQQRVDDVCLTLLVEQGDEG